MKCYYCESTENLKLMAFLRDVWMCPTCLKKWREGDKNASENWKKEKLNELKDHARWLYARIKDREYELEEARRTIKRIKSRIKEHNEELTATEEEIKILEGDNNND